MSKSMESPEKQVLFVGGVHGVGKTSLCSYLQKSRGALVIRQRHVLIELGKERSLGWNEVGLLHFELIDQVADKISQRIDAYTEDLAIVDCHYAIRSSKALRVRGKKPTKPYIADLDPVVVARLSSKFSLKMLLLRAEPETCLARLAIREPNSTEFEHTIEGLRLKEEAEIDHFNSLVQKFGSLANSHTVIRNDASINAMFCEVENFLGPKPEF